MYTAESALTPVYWRVFALIVASSIFEFFDFYVVGFIVSAVAPKWELTYGQSGIMLLSGGVGAIVGAMLSGRVADAIGRKSVFVATAMLSGLGSLAFVVEGDWSTFSLVRFAIGAGIGGGATVMNPYLVEYTPDRYRSFLPGIAITLGSIGTLSAGLSAGFLMQEIGWRGLAVMGSAPIVLALLAVPLLPESPRWLEARGLRKHGKAKDGTRPVAEPDGPSPSPFLIALAWLGASAAANGIYLWGPTILAMIMGAPIAEVGKTFIFVSLAGFAGKILFSALPSFVGRRRSAMVASLGAAAGLTVAAFHFQQAGTALSLFLIGLVIAAFFLEGGYANLTPFTAELFPVHRAARAVGLAQSANGLGKVVGPLLLALIAGTNDMIAPRATQYAILPGFLFLAVCALASFGVFMVCRTETVSRKLTL